MAPSSIPSVSHVPSFSEVQETVVLMNQSLNMDAPMNTEQQAAFANIIKNMVVGDDSNADVDVIITGQTLVDDGAARGKKLIITYKIVFRSKSGGTDKLADTVSATVNNNLTTLSTEMANQGIPNAGVDPVVTIDETESPTSAPTITCMDKSGTFHPKDPSKTCAWLGAHEWRRKNLCDVPIFFKNCPLTCGICCRDKPSFTFIFLKETRNCNWIKKPFNKGGPSPKQKANICSKEYYWKNCPKACDKCYEPIFYPTLSPSSPPSNSPTVPPPTSSPTISCMDKPWFKHPQDSSKTCAWVGETEVRRYNLCDKQIYMKNCPVTCGLCCRNKASFTFTFQKQTRGCNWLSVPPKNDGPTVVQKEKLCAKDWISNACTKSCQKCRPPITSPTSAPTAATTVCQDKLSWKHPKHPSKTCTWLGAVEWRRKSACKYPIFFKNCPFTCGICCRDSDSFQFKIQNVQRNCEWLGTPFNRGGPPPKQKANICYKDFYWRKCPQACDKCFTAV
jgi:hypothetical protein